MSLLRLSLALDQFSSEKIRNGLSTVDFSALAVWPVFASIAIEFAMSGITVTPFCRACQYGDLSVTLRGSYR